MGKYVRMGAHWNVFTSFHGKPTFHTQTWRSFLLLFQRLVFCFYCLQSLFDRTLRSLGVSIPFSASPVSVDYNFSHDPHLQARLAHAEKLWEQSVKDRQQMISAFGSRTRFPDGYIYPYNVWDFARPSFFCPHDLERVGTLGDGGKVVCGMSRYERESPGPSSESNPASSLIVYSFGVSTDSSFEAALLKRTNCEIWGYDYTVASFAEDIPGHQLPRTHFSQMDIEGAEFGALTSVIGSLPKDANGKHKPLPFGQLLIELHFDEGGSNQGGPRDLKTWMAWWSALEEHGLRPV